MRIYAEVKSGKATGVHKSFSNPPAGETWLPVEYGVRNPPFDPISQEVRAVRTIRENGTVFYEEVVSDLPFETVKTKKLERLKEQRAEELSGGFEFEGKHYQTRNEKDVSNIISVGLAATQALMSGSPFVVNFISSDNSITSMGANEAIGFYNTMIVAGQGVYNRYNLAREAVNSATTVDEVVSVVM